MKKIITVFLITAVTLFVFYKYIGKEIYYKSQDFKKLSGRVESCKMGDTLINKYTDKDNNLILSGVKGEYIPCMTENGNPTEMCESVISNLNNCETVFDNLSDKKVYNLKVSSSITSIKEAILKNELFTKEYNSKKEAEENKTTQVRKYKNVDYELTLKNERGIVFGEYTLKDIKSSKETKGEWIGAEENTNKLFIDETENTFLIKGLDLIYTKDKVSSTLKSTK
jgi:hypothetical protein